MKSEETGIASVNLTSPEVTPPQDQNINVRIDQEKLRQFQNRSRNSGIVSLMARSLYRIEFQGG